MILQSPFYNKIKRLSVFAVVFLNLCLLNKVLATNFVVTHTGATGSGSFSWALSQANLSESEDVISFNIPGSGIAFIDLELTSGSGLSVGNPVVIDGTTLPGYSPGSRHVVIKDQWGMSIKSTDVTLKGIELQHREGAAIYVGVDDLGYQHANITVQDNAFVFLGSAQGDGGIVIATGYSVSLLNNKIGFDFNGNPKGNPIPFGVFFDSFPDPVGGGGVYPTGNVISGNEINNAINGIVLDPTDSDPLIIQVKISKNLMTNISGDPLKIGDGHNLLGSGGRINPTINSALTTEVNGTTNANDVVELFITDASGKNINEFIGSTNANSTGSFTLGGLNLSEGSHVLVLSYDVNGNTSAFSGVVETTADDAIVVTKTSDDGSPGTLRWAIIAASFNAGPDKIHFNINVPGVPQIKLDNELPPISGNVIIDGTTQPGYNPGVNHVAIVNGTSFLEPLFNVTGSNTTIKGLEFYFERTGINVQDGDLSNIEISECSFRGHASSAGFFVGIELHSSKNFIINNNFFGTNYFKIESNFPLNHGIYFKDHTWETIDSRIIVSENYFGNCKNGITLEGHVLSQTIFNCKFSQNIFRNTRNKPIHIESPNNSFGPGFREVPVISTVSSNSVSGTANPNDWVEIYRSLKSNKVPSVWDAVQYINRVQANSSGNWSLTGMSNSLNASFIAKSYSEDVNGIGNSTEFGIPKTNNDPNSDACVVTNTRDYLSFETPIEGSLRWVMEKANNDPNCNTITFDLPGDGIEEIILKGGALPAITSPLTIDGTSLLDFNPNNERYVKIVRGPSSFAVFEIQASNTTIKGLELVTGNIGITIYSDVENITIENNAIRRQFTLSGTKRAISCYSAKNLVVKNNILGKDFSQLVEDKAYYYGVYFGDNPNVSSSFLANAVVEDNIIANCGQGIVLDGDAPDRILKNCFFTKNLFHSMGAGNEIAFSGNPISIKPTNNDFQNPREVPVINNVPSDFIGGTANPNDIVEIYRSIPGKYSKPEKIIYDIVEYLGNATADASGNWIFNYATSQGESYVAKSYDSSGKNSTEFGQPYNNCFLVGFDYETCVGLTVPFKAFVTGDAPTDLEFAWNFGHDFSLVLEKDPVHTFPSGFNIPYTVTLTVTGGGCSISEQKTIVVRKELKPDFDIPQSLCIGEELFFDNTTPDKIRVSKWEWNFGDGKGAASISNEIDGEHKYSEGGEYDVSLTAFPIKEPDGGGPLCEVKTTVKRIVLTNGAAVNIEGPDKVCKDVEITYRNSIVTPGVSYQWKVEGVNVDGTPEVMTHTFESTGTFEVELVADDGSCVVSDKLLVDVNNGPDFGPPVTSKANCDDANDGTLMVQVIGFPGEEILVELIKVTNVIRAQRVTSGTDVSMVGLTPGQYKLRASNELGCSKEISVNIGSLSPKINDACASRTNCNGQPSIVTFSFNASRSPGGSFNYKVIRISDNSEMENSTGEKVFGGVFGTIQSIELVNIINGNYDIVLLADPNTDNQCEVRERVRVRSLNIWVNSQLDNEDEVCVPTETKTVTISVNNNANSCGELTVNNINYKLFFRAPGPNSTFVLFENEDNPLSPFNFDNLFVGDYRVEVSLLGSIGSQSVECGGIDFFSIHSKADFYLDKLILTHPSCDGFANGSAEAIIKGTPEGIECYWFREGEADPINTDPYLKKITGLTPGNYRLEIQDAQGCTSLLPLDFTIEPAETLEVPTITLNGCEATATTTGGSPGYIFEWRRKLVGKNPISGEEYPPNSWELVLTDGGFNEGKISSTYKGKQGIFKVTAIDQKGCKETTDEFEIKTDVPQIVDLCFNWRLGTPEFDIPPTEIPDNPTQDKADDILVQINEEQDRCINKSATAVMDAVDEFCLNAEILEDELSVEYDIKHHHYTLYYYDRPGNLVKTIPPAGVNTTTQDHDYPTTYQYNSLAQSIVKNTVDGGGIAYRYDNLSRIRFSQDAKQASASPAQFSYINYDDLGRLVESGLVEGNFNSANVKEDISDVAYTILERSRTLYSTSSDRANYLGKEQRFLTNRVSSVSYSNKNGDNSFAYYSYDPHGNLEWMVCEIPGLGKTTAEYKYDVISSNVKQIILNKGRQDEYYHKYEYDEDNRITRVYTSKDGFLWENDATYSYFDHGSLRRTALGHDKIQGLDYVHTINGWLKGINTPDLDKTKDFGKDGNGRSADEYGPDVFGMALQYFNGDFERSGENPFNSKNSNPFHVTNNKELFNGNIASWASKINVPIPEDQYAYAGSVTAQNFSYDKLNRLKESNFLAHNGSSWISEGEKYKTSYEYDANGNFTGLDRFTKDGNEFDELTYHYHTNVLGKPTNRLKYIEDDGASIISNGKAVDIENQDDFNYEYDEIGNITEDKAEGLKFKWNNLKLIEEVIPIMGSEKPHIKFSYDGMGKRIKKWVNNSPDFDEGTGEITDNVFAPEDVVTTFYMRDGQGKINAICQRINIKLADDVFEGVYYLKEIPLIGTERLGRLNYNSPTVRPIVKFTFNKADNYEAFTLNHSLKNVKSFVGEQTSWFLANDDEQVEIEGENKTLPQTVIANVQLEDRYSGELAQFIGSSSKSIGSGINQQGSTDFVVTAANYWGEENTLLILNKFGEVVKGSQNIEADPLSKPVVVASLNKDGIYYAFTRNLSGELQVHELNANLAGYGTKGVLKGEASLVYTINSNGQKFGREFAIIENGEKDEKLVFGTLYDLSKKENHLIRFTLNKNGLDANYKLLAKVPSVDENGEGAIRFSQDGKSIFVYNQTKKIGFFNHHLSEIVRLDLNDEFEPIPNSNNDHLGVRLLEGNSDEKDFVVSSDGRFVYYNQYPVTESTSKGVYKKDLWLANQPAKEFISNKTGEIGYGEDGFYLFAKNQTNPTFWNNKGNELSDVVLYSNIKIKGGIGVPKFKFVDESFYSKDTRSVGLKQFELKDHLGNVRAVVTDRKLIDEDNGLIAEVIGGKNYLPFGMSMPGRNYSGEKYRYGFNGMEKDDEVKGEGNSYDFGSRLYDPRVGRWMSTDPMAKKFPSWSPYNFTFNDPIYFTDPTGNEPVPMPTSRPITEDDAGKKLGDDEVEGVDGRIWKLHPQDSWENYVKDEDEHVYFYEESGNPIRVKHPELDKTATTLGTLSDITGGVTGMVGDVKTTSQTLRGGTQLLRPLTAAESSYLTLKMLDVWDEGKNIVLKGITRVNSNVYLGNSLYPSAPGWYAYGSNYKVVTSTAQFSKALSIAGKVCGGGAILLTGAGYVRGEIGGYTATADIGFIVLGLAGGPVGAGIALSYTAWRTFSDMPAEQYEKGLEKMFSVDEDMEIPISP